MSPSFFNFFPFNLPFRRPCLLDFLAWSQAGGALLSSRIFPTRPKSFACFSIFLLWLMSGAPLAWDGRLPSFFGTPPLSSWRLPVEAWEGPLWFSTLRPVFFPTAPITLLVSTLDFFRHYALVIRPLLDLASSPPLLRFFVLCPATPKRGLSC